MNQMFVLGSINMDLVFQVDSLPIQGETKQSQDFATIPGGKGANQAVACAKQNVRTWMLGSVGQDSFSDQCLASLSKNGVDTRFVDRQEKNICGLATIILEQGDNRILTYGGANHHQDINKIYHVLGEHHAQGDYILSQLEIPIEVVQNVFRKAKTLGMITALNAAPAKPLSSDLLMLIDLLIVNEGEGQQLTGSDNPETIMNRLLSQGVGAVLLTRGAQGAAYQDQSRRVSVNAHKVKVVDTTAAGDTFIGVFLAHRIAGKEIDEALTYASAGAALSIQKLGAQNSIPSKQDIDEFIERSLKHR
jgi:ribokinase